MRPFQELLSAPLVPSWAAGSIRAVKIIGHSWPKRLPREELYSDFIAESARLLLDALEHNVTDRQSLIPVCAVLSRIRLSSSSRVLEKPETVLQSVLATYGKPTLTAEQITVSGREKSGPAKRVRRHLSQ